MLEYKYGQTSDISARLKKLESCKHSIARIFGLGKSSKAKPGPLLEHSRALYDNLSTVLKDAQSINFEDESFSEPVSDETTFEQNEVLEEKQDSSSLEKLLSTDDFDSLGSLGSLDSLDFSDISNLSVDDLPDFSMDDFK